MRRILVMLPEPTDTECGQSDHRGALSRCKLFVEGQGAPWCGAFDARLDYSDDDFETDRPRYKRLPGCIAAEQ